MAIRRSLGIAAPVPAKKIAYRKTAEDMKPAAKKFTDTKKLSLKPKVFVDTLYGNKILSGHVSIKQDKTTGKINLSQEFDKEATQSVPKSKEPKAKQDNQDKKKSTAPSESSGGQKPTDLTKPMGNENNKTTGTRVPDPKGSQPSNDVSSRPVLPAQGSERQRAVFLLANLLRIIPFFQATRK
jgi:hypothetical protein